MYLRQLSIVMFLLLIPNISNSESLKIFLLQSYGIQNSTGITQLYGSKDALSKLKTVHGYSLQIREFYMNSKKKNTTPIALRQIAKSALEEIENFNPDYIITFDDNAFRYVAIEYLLVPNSKNQWKVVFTGLNKSFFEYKEEFEFDESRVGGIEELIQLNKLNEWFKSVRFVPDKYYILRDNSPSSFYLSNNIEFELKKYGYKNYRTILIDNMQDLRRKVRRLNSESTGVIFAMQTVILNASSGVIHTIADIQKEITKVNTEHLETTVNVWATKPEIGFATSVGFDFWEMGNQAGLVVVDSVLANKFQNRVTTAVSTLSVNSKRMRYLDLMYYYKNALDLGLFDKIHTSIKD